VIADTRFSRARSGTRAATVIAILALMMSGCTLVEQITRGDTATRDDTGAVVEGNQNTDVFTLQVGDCLLDANTTTPVNTIATVPCDQPHDSEIYASIDVDGASFPGADALRAEAEASCMDAFPDFVGIDYADSKYLFTTFIPTENSWAEGDREILCTIYDDAGRTTGSLKNIGL
jgi:hypothetical protein